MARRPPEVQAPRPRRATPVTVELSPVDAHASSKLALAQRQRPPSTRWLPKACVVATDLVTICAAMLLAYRLQSEVPSNAGPPFAPGNHLLVGTLSLPLWMALFFHHGLYLGRRVSSRVEELRRIVHAVAGSVLGVIVLGFMLKLEVSRSWIVGTAAVACVMLALEREVVRRVFAAFRRRGALLRPVVIVGSNTEAMELCRLLADDRSLGYRVVGVTSDSAVPPPGDVPLLGRLEDTEPVVRRTGATGVILATSAVDIRTANALVRQLSSAGIHVELSSPVTEISAARLTVQPLGQSPVVYVEPLRLTGWRAAAKRGFDLVIACSTLLVTAPVLAVAAIAIKLDSKGPVLFRQVRVGQGGRLFTIVKLRSMGVDAEHRVAELQHRNEAPTPLFKIRQDPRVTRVGRILRRFSIDELPQFWNVVRGDMSVVGPRPALPSEVEAWTVELHKRLQLKPGITGMWQVNGRSNTTFADYARWDLVYLDKWSLWLDVAIVAKTIPAILCRRGAF